MRENERERGSVCVCVCVCVCVWETRRKVHQINRHTDTQTHRQANQPANEALILHGFLNLVLFITQLGESVDNDTKDHVEANNGHQNEEGEVKQRAKRILRPVERLRSQPFSKPTAVHQAKLEARHKALHTHT